jgi:RNA polymerase sigma-70 factor (ECF subfamily)
VLAHLDAAYTLARYLTRRSDAAEDIVQDALLRAYRSFETHRGGNTRAWLLAIVRNCFLTWKARGQNGTSEQPLAEGQAFSGEEAAEQETPETILIHHEQSGAIRAAIEQLPHFFREALVLRDIEDLSYREIAEITGVPTGTVMSRIARGRKMFAEVWKEMELASQKVRP